MNVWVYATGSPCRRQQGGSRMSTGDWGGAFAGRRVAVHGSEQFVYRALNRPFRRKETLGVEPAAPSETDIDEPGMN